MKKIKIIITCFLLGFTCTLLTGQEAIVKADTTGNKLKQSSGAGEKTMNQGAGNKAGRGGNGQAVKQIRGARPDFTRVQGARAPQITRPSGTAVPKGMGKPGGAGRRGGR